MCPSATLSSTSLIAMCALYAGFYNNVLVGVAHAQAVHDVRRIAILDFDVCDACDTQHGTCPSRAHRVWA